MFKGSFSSSKPFELRSQSVARASCTAVARTEERGIISEYGRYHCLTMLYDPC
jgi:hypothetical protein